MDTGNKNAAGNAYNVEIVKLYDLSHTLAGDYLKNFTYPWKALNGIKDLILYLGRTLSLDEYDEVSPFVWVHKTAKIFPSAYLGAPCIIGPETEVPDGYKLAANRMLSKSMKEVAR